MNDSNTPATLEAALVVQELDLDNVPREELSVFNTIALIEMGEKARDLKGSMEAAQQRLEHRNVFGDFLAYMAIIFRIKR